MIPNLQKFSRVVRFSPEEADQVLLASIAKALEKQPHRSFSDLCKQALRQFLLPTEETPTASLMAMQQQILELQLQLARLQGEATVKQQLGQLCDRLDSLEGKLRLEESPLTESLSINQAEIAPSAAIEAELDPILRRLVPLLEDF